MILNCYEAPCPRCGRMWLGFLDLRVDDFGDEAAPVVKDEELYGILEPCLYCGLEGRARCLPQEARPIPQTEDRVARLERELEAFGRAGGHRPEAEAVWREILSGKYGALGLVDRASAELERAIGLLWPTRRANDGRLLQLLSTLLALCPVGSMDVARAYSDECSGPHAASLLTQLASAYARHGRYEPARDCLERAWRLFGQASDASTRNQGIATCAHELIGVYRSLGRIDEARACELEVARIWGSGRRRT